MRIAEHRMAALRSSHLQSDSLRIATTFGALNVGRNLCPSRQTLEKHDAQGTAQDVRPHIDYAAWH